MPPETRWTCCRRHLWRGYPPDGPLPLLFRCRDSEGRQLTAERCWAKDEHATPRQGAYSSWWRVNQRAWTSGTMFVHRNNSPRPVCCAIRRTPELHPIAERSSSATQHQTGAQRYEANATRAETSRHSSSLSHVEPLASASTPPRSFLEVIRCSSVRLACLTHKLGLLRKLATVGIAPSRTLGLVRILDELDKI